MNANYCGLAEKKISITDIDATEAHIPCSANFTMNTNPEFCKGYKAGYSHEALDEMP